MVPEEDSHIRSKILNILCNIDLVLLMAPFVAPVSAGCGGSGPCYLSNSATRMFQ